MAKKNKMINLSEEVLKSVDENPLINNFSEWVEETYKATFLVEENLLSELESVRKKAHSIEKMIKKLVEKEPKIGEKTSKIDKKSDEFFDKYGKILRIGYLSVKNGFDEDAVLKRLSFEYGVDWTKKQFKIYCDRYKVGVF